MNFLKKKLKPLTSGFNQSTTSGNQRGEHNKDLEDDLYDEYVVEAPPHPSELLKLGVGPNEIDVNDPDKLRELYRKAKEQGKDKLTNSVLLARERQKEEIEEKKRTREEWKFFDSLTTRVEQVVKESQTNLENWKEKSVISKLDEPEYELRETPDLVLKSAEEARQEKERNEALARKKKEEEEAKRKAQLEASLVELDEFGFPKPKKSQRDKKETAEAPGAQVVQELLNDLGIDLRPTDQKQKQGDRQQAGESRPQRQKQVGVPSSTKQASEPKLDIDIKAAARPRPRPKTAREEQELEKKEQEFDPFDTSFVASEPLKEITQEISTGQSQQQQLQESKQQEPEKPKALDPFDTSYVNLE